MSDAVFLLGKTLKYSINVDYSIYNSDKFPSSSFDRHFYHGKSKAQIRSEHTCRDTCIWGNGGADIKDEIGSSRVAVNGNHCQHLHYRLQGAWLLHCFAHCQFVSGGPAWVIKGRR